MLKNLHNLFLFLFIISGSVAFGQITYAVTNEKKIYQVNNDFSLTYVCTAGPTQYLINDIAISPSGNMYGIAYNTLYQINTQTGATTWIADFPPNFYVSMVCSNDHELYLINNQQRTLYKYNLQTNVLTNVAYLGFTTSGDLAFYKGHLIFQTHNDNGSMYMLKAFNLQNNSLIDIMCQSFYFQLWGLANYDGCDGENVLAVNPANQFLILNFNTQSYTTQQFMLPNQQQIYGLARTDEHLGSLCPVGSLSNLSCELSVANLSRNTFAIFPNPAQNILNFKSAAVISEIQIYDLSGKIVIDLQDNDLKEADVSRLSSGFYLVKATSDYGTTTAKFFKQ